MPTAFLRRFSLAGTVAAVLALSVVQAASAASTELGSPGALVPGASFAANRVSSETAGVVIADNADSCPDG